jgi:hypothetical protein
MEEQLLHSKKKQEESFFSELAGTHLSGLAT